MRNHTLLIILAIVAGMLCVVSTNANAQGNYDVGQIAIIEDIHGNILPESGMCDNMLFAQGLCVNHAAQAFYTAHPDNYDILVFFTPKILGALFDVKMGFPVQIAAEGIGLESTSLFNPGQFGSDGRLRQCVKMGSLPDLPNNPNDLYTMPPITGIELLAHEIGHQWMAWITVDHNDGRGSIPILRGWESDSPNGHWSCWFNNHGSVMYGGNLTDNGDGTFTDTGSSRKYSQLDQYLMGLRTADEVDDMWYVDVDGTTEGCPSMPNRPGGEWVHEGTRVNFPIEDIIRANGPRVPELENCHLKAGFAIFYQPGSPPTNFDIAKVDSYRTELQNWWPQGTDLRGSLDTRLDGCGTGTDTCPGEVSSQCGTPVDGDSIDGDVIDGDSGCTFNEFRCNGTDSVEICNPSGEWVWLQNCGNGQVCKGGMCVDVTDGDSITDGDELPADGDTSSPDGDKPQPDGDQIDGDNSVVDPADGDNTTSNPNTPEYPTDTDGDLLYPVGNNGETNPSGSGSGCSHSGDNSTSTETVLLLTMLLSCLFQRDRKRRLG